MQYMRGFFAIIVSRNTDIGIQMVKYQCVPVYSGEWGFYAGDVAKQG
ncbi:hypothetical protein ASZ90_015355 [hydrocarbon metagenome]|uniref:Uncharacterized protein n=1 Tax=hydrocarbon metagenome TaxID=938273 RepID=A0A0W8F290_9ZZZZ